MPRKRPRPAAKKLAKRRKEAMNKPKKRRVSTIAHHRSGSMGGLALAALIAGHLMANRKGQDDG